MLIPMLSSISFFTDNRRYKTPAHNSNKPTRKEKRGSRAYLDETEDGRRVQRDRGVAAREAAQKNAEAAFLENERAKKARYENISSVRDLGKVDFRCMREQQFFDMPQDSNNPLFWRKEQALVMMKIYAKLSTTKAVL